MTRIENFRSIILSIILTGIGLLPFVWWLSVLTFAWRASKFLGHWPSSGNPDPKTLPLHFNPGTEMLDWIIPTTGFVFFVLLLAYPLRRLESSKLRLQYGLTFLITGWITSLILFWLDPDGIVGWICD